MLHRWLASLCNSNFKLNYKTGKSNRDADGLCHRRAEIFPNVIKAFTSAVLVGKEEHPLAESIVSSENASLEKANEDKEMQEFSSIDWAFEQRKDTAIKRAIEILDTRFKPSGKELNGEHIEVRKYLRAWNHFEICKNVLLHHTLVDGKHIRQIVLLAFQGIHDDACHQGRDKTLWLAKQRLLLGWNGERNQGKSRNLW